MSWFADSMISRPPRSDEEGLIVRPIFSGSDPNVLTVQLASGSISLGPLSFSGSLIEPKPNSSLMYAVSRSNTQIVISSGSIDRLGFSVYNNSRASFYLSLGSVASTASYTVKLISNAFYEIPFPIYTGVITGIWATSGSGNVMVTELSP